jgi:hypothetical protein
MSCEGCKGRFSAEEQSVEMGGLNAYVDGM